MAGCASPLFARTVQPAAAKIVLSPIDYRPIGSYNKRTASSASGFPNDSLRREERMAMEKGNTKQEILDVALELFSIKGYEATSLSMIADAIGIRKASLYSHFTNKQDILDTLVEEILSQYYKHSLFASADWDDPNFTKDKLNITPEALANVIKGQVRYILYDPHVSKARKMLVIEQFQNPELAKLQTKQNYDDIMRYHLGLVRFLIRQNILADDDPEIMASQLCLPISIWINLCDREPEREAEVMELIERHILQFFRVYKK